MRGANSLGDGADPELDRLVNRCIIAFRDLSRKASMQIEPGSEISLDDEERGFVDKPARTSVEDIAITNMIKDVTLRTAAPAEGMALVMLVAGYTHAEIRAATGLETIRSVEGRLYRFRQMVRKRFRGLVADREPGSTSTTGPETADLLSDSAIVEVGRVAEVQRLTRRAPSRRR